MNKDIFRDYTFDAFINYDKTLGEDHNIKATLGTSVFETSGIFSGTTQGFFETDVDFASAKIEDTVDQQNGLKDSGLSGEFRDRLLSYFLRGQYNYKGKYLISAIIRRDGSSKFGPNNRFGYFPSGSVGWVASDENFMEDSKVINFMKFRGSYGIVGNDRIPSNAFRSVLSGEAAYVFSNELVFGKAVGVLSNPEIQWEEQKTLDVGVDMRLFDNRIDITADYFNKRTDGLLLQPPVSGILGAAAPGSQPPVVNAGIVDNSGFEFAVGYSNNSANEFTFGINYNVTFLNNKVVSVNNGVGFIAAGSFGVGQEPPSRMESGKPYWIFLRLANRRYFSESG